MQPPPTRLDAQLLLNGDIYVKELLDALLSALEGIELLAPDQWGISAGIRDPYNRTEVVAAMVAEPHAVFPRLFRTDRAVAYSGRLLADPAVSTLSVESRGSLTEYEMGLAFDAFGALASRLPVEWGHIAPAFDHVEEAHRLQVGGNFTHLGHYQRYGPCCLFPRTFLGRGVIGLIGKGNDTLMSLGLDAKPLENGVFQLDLVPRPWASDPATLKRAQQQVHAKLEPTGILGSSPGGGMGGPGLRWRPPGDREEITP
jgi:hypothetical protein